MTDSLGDTEGIIAFTGRVKILTYGIPGLSVYSIVWGIGVGSEQSRALKIVGANVGQTAFGSSEALNERFFGTPLIKANACAVVYRGKSLNFASSQAAVGEGQIVGQSQSIERPDHVNSKWIFSLAGPCCFS